MSGNNGKVPPHSLEDEMACLGSMILDPDAIPQAASLLTADDFYRNDHRQIFQAITNIFERNDPIDVVQLRNELSRTGKLDEVGGIEYPVRLTESVPSSANTEFYAKEIRDRSLRRQLISAGSSLAHQAYDETVSLDELSNQLETDVLEIADKVIPDMIALDTVQTEPVHWLWNNRFPLGKLSVIAGDPGLGKSFLTLSMAAYVSAGIPWPDEPNERNPGGKVILLSAEDDIADTIKPRLNSMSADCKNIIAIESVKSLDTDVSKLERAIKKTEGIRLVVIDPISAYIGVKRDGHSNTEIRAILAPLAKLAANYRVTVLAVSHLNKGGQASPLYRIMGSLAFSAAPRTVWAVIREEQPDPLCKTYRRLLLPIKNNLAPDTGTGMAFSIMDGRVVWEPMPIQISAQGEG